MSNFFKKHAELISYIFFGVLTTAVNFVVFYVLERIFSGGELLYLVNNAIAWFVSVVFAYVTNKLFVFKAKSAKLSTVVRELIEFFGARIFSFAIEEAGLFLFVDLLGFGSFSKSIAGFLITGEIIAKLVLAVIVVILNYFFSKFIIFKKSTAE